MLRLLFAYVLAFLLSTASSASSAQALPKPIDPTCLSEEEARQLLGKLATLRQQSQALDAYAYITKTYYAKYDSAQHSIAWYQDAYLKEHEALAVQQQVARRRGFWNVVLSVLGAALGTYAAVR